MLLKALIIAIFASLSACCEAGMWVIQMQPLVSGAITGLLLGDWQAGCLIGATIQLLYMGQIQVGGVTAYDFTFAGVIAPAVAIVSHMSTDVAITMAVAIGSIGLISNNINMTVNAVWVHMADKYAEKGETKNIWIYNWLLPVLTYTVLYGIPAFLAIYFGAQYLEGLMNSLPAFINNGLAAVGTLLPALGIGMMLKVVYNKKYIALGIIGYLFSAYFNMPIIGIALFAGAITLIYWQMESKNTKITEDK